MVTLYTGVTYMCTCRYVVICRSVECNHNTTGMFFTGTISGFCHGLDDV